MTDKQRGLIKRLLKHGWPMRAICQNMGLSYYQVLKVKDPDQLARRLFLERERRAVVRARQAGINPHMVFSSTRPDPVILQKLMDEIPPDTRDVTGVLMGDPLPSRSALDMRK